MAMLNNQMVFFAITIGLFEHITLDCFFTSQSSNMFDMDLKISYPHILVL